VAEEPWLVALEVEVTRFAAAGWRIEERNEGSGSDCRRSECVETMSNVQDQQQAVTRKDLGILIAAVLVVAGAFAYLDGEFDTLRADIGAISSTVNEFAQRVAHIEGLIEGLWTSNPDVMADNNE